MGLSLNSQNWCDVQWHFSFAVSESCDRDVSYAHDRWLLIYLAMQSIANITFYLFLQIKTFFQIFRSSTWKCNSFNWFPCEKMSEIFWHKRCATWIQKGCITNVLGWSPPFFPLIVGKKLFFYFLIIFEIVKLIWGNLHNPSPPSHFLSSFLNLK